MTPAARNVILGAPFDPYRLGNNAAAYSLSGAAGDSTYLIDGSNLLYYVADRSGNSAVNGLITPGVTGNNATTPDASALDITSLDFAVRMSADDWTPSGNQVIAGKVTTFSATAMSWYLQVGTTGLLTLVHADGTSTFIDTSTVAPTISDFGNLWVRVTMEPNVAGSRNTKFYTAPDAAAVPTAWTQLGTTVTGAASLGLYNSTSVLSIGGVNSFSVFSGRIYYATMSAFGGSAVFTADFTALAKLNGGTNTFVCTTGQTVMINQTSIALPARIHGARDLYQYLTASMPTFSVSAGYNIATFDGTADYLKSAPFSLSQPESVYFVGSQVSWTLNDYFYDGNGNSVMGLTQTTGTPQINTYAGTFVGTTSPAIGSRFVDTAVFNGASSSHRLNKDAAVTGSSGAQNATGFTLGSTGVGSNFGNITWSESLLRSAADNAALQLRIAAFEMRKWGVS